MGERLTEERLRAAMAAERASLAKRLATLTEAQWRHPSLCARWDVEHVVAHLTAGASVGQWAWLRSIVAAGFRPSVHNARRLREHQGTTPAETFEKFRAIVGSTTTPSEHVAAYLGEVVVHGQDICQPLGIDHTPDVEHVTPVLAFYTERDFAVKSASTAKGLSLRASDGPFVAGSGPEVTGPTLSLVMVLAGRPAFLDQLDGPGVDVLAKRIA